MQYASSIADQIARVGDVINGKKAADIILKDGTVIDVKYYDFSQRIYRFDFAIQSEIKKMTEQIALRRLQYPNAPIRYVFVGTTMDQIPPKLLQALRDLGVEVVVHP